MDKLNGHCECRKVEFNHSKEITYFSHCHCSQCRRCHGSAFGSYIEVDKSSFEYTSGDNNLKTYSSSKLCERVFCMNCGSNIMFINKNIPDKYYVSIGLINGNLQLPKAHHIFVGSKASWYKIDDDLEQHQEYPTNNDD
tara:strand:- start:151 stop:567 length:417 start_codon:yes stop_codon:yes gene_type:complete